MVLSALPLVHSIVCLCSRQLSSQRFCRFWMCLCRRGDSAAKNRSIRSCCQHFSVGGLAFPNLSDCLLLAHWLQRKTVSGAGCGLDSGCSLGTVVSGGSARHSVLADAWQWLP